MTSKGLFFFEASVSILIISGVGFTAWQTQRVVRSLNQMVAAQEETLEGMKTSLARTEQEVRKVSGSVRPNVEKWVKALEKRLLAKTNSMVRKTQRSEVDAALKEWSERARQQDQKQWEKLFATVSKEQKQAQQQYQQAEKQWQEMAKTLREGQEVTQKQNKQNETRWVGLMETLLKQGERSDKQYREVVQRLSKEKEEALARTRQLEAERKRDVNKLLEQAKQIEQQRKRQLGEFCSKRPESVICRDQ
jgi:hypothetical protein